MTDTEKSEPGFVLLDTNGRICGKTSFFTNEDAARSTAEAMKLDGYVVTPAKRVSKMRKSTTTTAVPEVRIVVDR